jgi:hypothetical protein
VLLPDTLHWITCGVFVFAWSLCLCIKVNTVLVLDNQELRTRVLMSFNELCRDSSHGPRLSASLFQVRLYVSVHCERI